MTKIQEFNLQYNLTNISVNAFAKIEKQDIANDLAGKPKKNIIEIAKRFFTNPISVSALLIFVTIVLLSIIFPLISPYSSENSIIKTSGNTEDTFKNLPPHGQLIKVVADSTLINRLNAFNIHFTEIKFDEIDPIVTGRYVIEYDPWALANAADNYSHHSIIGTNVNAVDI